MAFLAGLRRYRSMALLPSIQTNYDCSLSYLSMHPDRRPRWFSTSTESSRHEFPVENAYDILEVSETSSFAEIKASFRRLAKETHPDLAEPKNDYSSPNRFLRIIAAYEILSDSEKREHYDRYLLSQRKVVIKHHSRGSTLYRYEPQTMVRRQMEVVEWLKWYRVTINDILLEKKVAVGTGYFDVLEADFYSAVRAAYFGPELDSMDLLPDCFEAEERSVYETLEVLHLVSGRDMFGMVCLIDDFLELPSAYCEKLASFSSIGPKMQHFTEKSDISSESAGPIDIRLHQLQGPRDKNHVSHAYKDIELHISGRVVATASRFPPKSLIEGKQIEGDEDHIHVFLNLTEESKDVTKLFSDHGSRILIGTISGLRTSPDEGSCYVYNENGAKTHVIMKHRTLLVRHMHWYKTGDKVSICECRCSRARLPPSRFWLFEPRSSDHDIGGWYIETFGKDNKGRTILSQRFWDGLDGREKFDGRLHPAIYLLALAYRTLDLEDERRGKRSLVDFTKLRLIEAINWCKKHVWRG